jgi:hypothetical protein
LAFLASVGVRSNSDNPSDGILKFWVGSKTGLLVLMAIDEAMEKYVSPTKGGMAKGSKAAAPLTKS